MAGETFALGKSWGEDTPFTLLHKVKISAQVRIAIQVTHIGIFVLLLLRAVSLGG
jgi:hypothetical protein